MRFRIMGPMQWWDGAAWASPGAPKQRLLLAILLIEAGHVVSTDRLVDEVWGERPPRAAVSTIQQYVMRLRRLLGPRTRLVTRDRGYQLRIDGDDTDAAVFERLVDRGKQRLAGGALDAGVAHLTQALALWRGPALADVPASTTVSLAAVRLGQRRLTALELRLGAELELGRHADLVDELQTLVAEHPLRERLRAQLMLALYRGGRRGEALSCYREGHAVLAGELGLEPGPELRDLQRDILADDDRLAPPTARTAAATVPAQLPADVAGFTGRTEPLRHLDRLLPGNSSRALVVSTIAGPGGVGKSALAVHWAHRVRDRYPDAQLYVNLRGYAAGAPLRPIDALARFLRALGVPAEEIPVDEDHAAAVYRSLLTGKRMLILLDNARHPDQVRPLLPGTGDCLVLVTSRDQLAGLVACNGASRLDLDVLTAPEAQTLLTGLLGARRTRAEPAAVAELAELCGYLPLALRIAAANLTNHPRHSIAAYVARMREDRLAALEIDGDPQAAIRTTFELSYAGLSDDARRVFRTLGLVPGPDVTAEAVAALVDLPPARARRLLARLASEHLVDEHDPGRYAMHDLIRLYAAERAADTDPAPDRRAALARLFDHYVHTADAAARQLYPDKLRLPVPSPSRGFATLGAALAWLDAERHNLIATVRYAAAGDHRPVAWRLADVLRGYFESRVHAVDWLAVAKCARDAAELDGEPRAEMIAEISLGGLERSQSRPLHAIEHYQRALDLARSADWPLGHGAVLGNLGNVHFELGDLRLASERYAEALAIYRRTGWRPGQAINLGNVADCYRELGRLAEAFDAFGQAVSLYREIGARGGEAETLRRLAATHLDAGDATRALFLARQAYEAAGEVGDQRFVADALNTLGAVRCHLAAYPDAIEDHERALDLGRTIGNRYTEATALAGLATAHRHAGDPGSALEHGRAALAIARRTGYRGLEALALTTLAEILVEHGSAGEASDHAEQAMAIHRETGHHLAQARATQVLAIAGQDGARADVGRPTRGKSRP